MKKDILYLKDIAEAIKSIQKFTQDMNFKDFKDDDKTSSAVMRKFEIIGEATKNIPSDVRKNYSKIPWKEMAGLRDKLIHAYFQVDYNLVWTTIQESLPQVLKLIERILLKERN